MLIYYQSSNKRIMPHKKINYKKELLSAWEVAKINKTTMHHVSTTGKDEMKVALGIIAMSSLLSVIGLRYVVGIFEPTFFYSLKILIMGILTPVAGIYVLSFIAQKLFKGKAKHHGFFNVMGYGMIVTWLSVFYPTEHFWSYLDAHYYLQGAQNSSQAKNNSGHRCYVSSLHRHGHNILFNKPRNQQTYF